VIALKKDHHWPKWAPDRYYRRSKRRLSGYSGCKNPLRLRRIPQWLCRNPQR